MRTLYTIFVASIVALATLMVAAVPAQAQQVTIGTPYHNLQSSFFENAQMSWSGHINFQDNSPNHSFPNQGITFSYGGGALAVPQFGTPQPGAGLTTGFAIVTNKSQFNFNINYGQGARMSSVTQTPSVTIMNGQTGYVSDSSITPFVMGVIPVVGGFPVAPQQFQQFSGNDSSGVDPRIQAMMQAHADAQDQAAAQAAAQAQAGGVIQPLPQQVRPNNLAPQVNQKQMNVADPVPAAPDPGDAAAERLNNAQESTAGRPAVSVAEAKNLHEQELARANGEMAALMERARTLEEDGKPSVAKIYYQRIAKHATGDLQQQARTRLYELQTSDKQ